jgi:hypothetical protein
MHKILTQNPDTNLSDCSMSGAGSGGLEIFTSQQMQQSNGGMKS